jgi:hypothetical protein
MDWIEVHGLSMCPFLPEGNWVGIEWLAPESASEPALGEIVLSRADDGTWTVHRVVGKKGSFFFIKGDASRSCETLDRNHVWARVKAIRPAGSFVGIRFRPGRLDRWIARVSYLSARLEGRGTGVLRRTVTLLARLKGITG